MSLLFSSFIIGFSAAATPGVVQMTILQNSFMGKKKESFLLALGVASMNFIILILSYFGISQFIKIPWLYYLIGILGLGYMLYVGITGLLKSLGKLKLENKFLDKQSFVGGMLLCLLSPLTYVYFIGVATSFLSIKKNVLFEVGLNSLSLAVGSFVCFSLVTYLGLIINKYGKTWFIKALQIVSSIAIIFFSIRLFVNLF